MGERDSYAPGTFCWAELGTTDVEAATAFYGEVFGWEVDADGDAGLGSPRSDVAGVEAADEAAGARGLSVEDVDALVERVRELGRRGAGRAARRRGGGAPGRRRRPDGCRRRAVAAARDGRRRAGQRRRLHVLERARLTRPRPRARVLRRAARVGGRAGGDRLRRHPAGGAVNGGIRPQQDGEPAHWLVYFTVESCDDAVAAVRAGGGPSSRARWTPRWAGWPQSAIRRGRPFAVFEGEVDP